MSSTAAPRHEPDADASARGEATLYYDGSCPACAREIGFYRPRAEGVCFVDVSRCGDEALGGDLDRRAALDRLHLRTPDGTLISGAEAIAGVWRRVPGLGWLGRAFAHPLPAQALEAFYRAFLALRARLPRFFRSHCGTPPAGPGVIRCNPERRPTQKRPEVPKGA